MADEEVTQQDMPVADKLHPTLGATEEEQDVSSLNRIIVPVGAYTDPSNPAAASASVNLTLDKSPVEHSEDYGQSDLEEAGVEADPVSGTMDATEMRSEGVAARSEDREEWTKEDWQEQAREYDLPVSGNKDTIAARVEAYEDEQKSASSSES